MTEPLEPPETTAVGQETLQQKTHERLVALQTTEELRRKCRKSHQRARLWTQEEIDMAKRLGAELVLKIRPGGEEPQARLDSNQS